VRKWPVIGVLIAAALAAMAMMKRKKAKPEDVEPPPA
jgi:hypothetical protein